MICSVRGGILEVASFRNLYDGHTIYAALEQVLRLTARLPSYWPTIGVIGVRKSPEKR